MLGERLCPLFKFDISIKMVRFIVYYQYLPSTIESRFGNQRPIVWSLFSLITQNASKGEIQFVDNGSQTQFDTPLYLCAIRHLSSSCGL